LGLKRTWLLFWNLQSLALLKAQLPRDVEERSDFHWGLVRDCGDSICVAVASIFSKGRSIDEEDLVEVEF